MQPTPAKEAKDPRLSPATPNNVPPTLHKGLSFNSPEGGASTPAPATSEQQQQAQLKDSSGRTVDAPLPTLQLTNRKRDANPLLRQAVETARARAQTGRKNAGSTKRGAESARQPGGDAVAAGEAPRLPEVRFCCLSASAHFVIVQACARL